MSNEKNNQPTYNEAPIIFSDDEQKAYDELVMWADARMQQIDSESVEILSQEIKWNTNSCAKTRTERTKKPTLTSQLLPTKIGNEGPVDVALGLYDDTKNMLRTAKNVAEDAGVTPRKTIATVVTAASLMGVGMHGTTQKTSTEATQPVASGLAVSRTVDSTIVKLGDISDQNDAQSRLAVAQVLNISPESQKITDNALVLPGNVTNEQAVTAAIAYLAPDTPKEATPEVQKTPEIAPAVQALNDALNKIDIHSSVIDISAVRDAVIAMDAWYAPQDKDRMATMPEGYIKVLLPHEAVGLAVPMTVAERTADVERYTSPTMAALNYVSAKVMQDLIAQKYPNHKDAMWRLRDFEAPVHKTHNDGKTADISSAVGYEVTQYSDGPFADSQFSDNYDKTFTEEMYAYMAKITDADGPVISSVLISDASVVDDINNLIGRNFLQDAKYHGDHGHVTLEDRFELPQWRPRASDLPWTPDQDLRVASMAVAISAEQHNSQHADFESFVAEKDQPTPQTPTPEITAPVENHDAELVPEILTPEATELINTLDLSEDRKDFLRKMLPSITAVVHKGAKINPEVVLAQTTLETGFGHDGLSGKTNNFFGIKAGKNWKGEVYVADTQEEYIAGDVVTIKDGFRVYKNPAESVADYAELIQNAPHYADAVKNYQNAEGYVNGLFNEVDNNGNITREQGSEGVLSYGTDRGYEQKVLQVIDKYKYAQLVSAQLSSKQDNSSASQDSATTTVAPAQENAHSDKTSTTVNDPELVSDTVITNDLFVDEATARHIYEGYFVNDPEGLDEWVRSLPQKSEKDTLKFGINANNTPSFTNKGDN